VRPFFVAGAAETSDDVVAVRHPYDDSVAGRTALATPEQVERAVAAAAAVAPELAGTPAYVRAAALDLVSARLAERCAEAAALITAESGKPIRWARAEVTRAVSVFRWAAEETRRFGGELHRLDTDPASAGRLALVRRAPRGPVLGITPFNFPLNLVAHKVAPAVAVGAPVVVKPAPATPLSALLLGELLAGADLPPGAFSVLPLPNDRAAALVADPRLPVVSFTGSGPVGAAVRAAVPGKHVTLELGGNAAAVVCADFAGAGDLDRAAARIATFGTYQGGQSCISVQRVIVHETLYPAFLPRLLDAVAALRDGDPRDERVDVGPLISTAAARRVEDWVDEAVAAGATLLAGGVRAGAHYAPTVLADVPRQARVHAEEVFGPVLVVGSAPSDAAAFAAVNDSAYGLQAGVFTHDLGTAFTAFRTLDVGGVVIGDVPSYRADQMPYGGVKASGVGREGVASAMRDYTEERVLVLTGISV
jgi:glyceraldehyde-3-phosphate dehydrogenase (NADP+)